MFCSTREYFSESEKFQQNGINGNDSMSDSLVYSSFLDLMNVNIVLRKSNETDLDNVDNLLMKCVRSSTMNKGCTKLKLILFCLNEL